MRDKIATPGYTEFMHQHFAMFARYNAWANSRLYDAAAELSDSEYRADRGAFFSSVHGTLNHLLVTDRIWMHRFTGQGPTYRALDAILYDAFEQLRAAREQEDERIVAFVDSLDEASLAAHFSYTRASTAESIVQPLASALSHLFSHQTHHRGQVHMLLTGLGREAPPLDLAFFQRETGIGMT